MIKIDHCVIQINDNVAHLNALQQQITPLGFPFDPLSGKGTAGFKVANLFGGSQYWELVWLKRPDGGGWRPEWVERYNQGQRGLICLMLLTDQLATQWETWHQVGLAPTAPERITYRMLGVLAKTLPWRNAYLGPIPGTDLQIGLQEMDSAKAYQRMEQYAVPNARANGILGFRRVLISHAFTGEAWQFLHAAFPHAAAGDEQLLRVLLDDQQELCFIRTSRHSLLQAEVQALALKGQMVGTSFSLTNVTMRLVAE